LQWLSFRLIGTNIWIALDCNCFHHALISFQNYFILFEKIVLPCDGVGPFSLCVFKGNSPAWLPVGTGKQMNKVKKKKKKKNNENLFDSFWLKQLPQK
jgi:hypothetical protein